MRKFFILLRKDQRGATLVEYGIALFVAITVGGTLLTTLATTTSTNVEDANTAATR
ncbi:Flp family type IVb pilin [Rhodobacterales bacterium HKCCE3408]|nr:Flp family type IVb pilin [Rhodobacterales bacterium HKCCE3408]